MVHVPFKGAVSIPDVIAGRVQMVFSGVPQALTHVQAGRLRPIGVTTPRRSPAVPDVPTLSEAGVTGYEVTVWYGIFATGGTPRTIVSRLNADFVKAINTPDVRQQLTAMGLDPVGNSSAEFNRTVRSEIKQWGDVIRRAGIKQQ
jgi:tripartite-type tricarboxylate transporter receptor subunit TctC